MESTPETLDTILKKLLSAIPEVNAAAIVSVEGLPIASALPQGVDETRIAAMTAALLSLAERTALEMNKGEFEQVYVKGSSGYLLVLSAGQNAVLTVSTTKDVRLGLVLLDCKRTCEKIAKLI
jgi:predicted regulator of Ras-like GTPase activity (Roadblock/LC7/MglB family)